MSEFRDIVGTEGLDPDEEARLRRVHDLLVQAGPPPDLPPALERTPEAAEAEIVQFPLLPAPALGGCGARRRDGDRARLRRRLSVRPLEGKPTGVRGQQASSR